MPRRCQKEILSSGCGPPTFRPVSNVASFASQTWMFHPYNWVAIMTKAVVPQEKIWSLSAIAPVPPDFTTHHRGHHQVVVPPTPVEPTNSYPEPQEYACESNRDQRQLHDHETRAPRDGVDVVWSRPSCQNLCRWEPHGERMERLKYSAVLLQLTLG